NKRERIIGEDPLLVSNDREAPRGQVASDSRSIHSVRPIPPQVTPAPVTFTVRANDPQTFSAVVLLDPGLQVPYMAVPPVLDGLIGPDEYGPALHVEFTGDQNPGRILLGSVDGPEDLSCQFSAIYTNTDLFVAVRVWDDVVSSTPENAK